MPEDSDTPARALEDDAPAMRASDAAPLRVDAPPALGRRASDGTLMADVQAAEDARAAAEVARAAAEAALAMVNDAKAASEEAAQVEQARFLWSVAGQIAAGMLANPAKQYFSVKDSISLFDELIHEIESYSNVRGDFGAWADSIASEHEERRREQRAFAFNDPSSVPGAPIPGHPAAGHPRQPAPVDGGPLRSVPNMGVAPVTNLHPGGIGPAPTAPPQIPTQSPSHDGGIGLDLPDLPLPPASPME